MTQDDLVVKLENLIKQKFPSAIVRRNSSVPLDGDTPAFDVFSIPNDVSVLFIKYVIDEFSEAAERAGIPNVDLIPHSAEDTVRFYSHVLGQVHA